MGFHSALILERWWRSWVPLVVGKTTLLNCLSGLDNFDSGSVWIEGQMLTQLNDRKRTAYRASRMGFIFQTFNLLPVISAQENVELPLLINGIAARQVREQAREVLVQVGLEGGPYTVPHSCLVDNANE